MTSNKNIKVFFITLSTIFFLYFIYSTTNTPDEQELQKPSLLITSNTDNTTKVNPEKITAKKQENESNTLLKENKELQLSHNTPKEITKLIELQKKRKQDPTVLLTIEELPMEQQEVMKKWLSSLQNKGYISSRDVAFDYIELQNNQAGFIDLKDPSIAVSLQDIENTKLSSYEYKGAILDQIEGAEHLPIQGIKRLYTDPKGNEITLHEKSLANSNTLLIKEFISDEVKGYPAMTMTLCTETQRCISKITFMTQDKSYEIIAKGDQESTKEQLLEIAYSLELPQIKKIQH